LTQFSSFYSFFSYDLRVFIGIWKAITISEK
jgi:hypothetical protein